MCKLCHSSFLFRETFATLQNQVTLLITFLQMRNISKSGPFPVLYLHNITHWSHSMPQSPSSLRWSPSPVSRQRAWFSISAHSSSSSSSLHHHQHSNASSAGCWSRHHHTISQPESCSCGLVMDGASHWAEKDTGGGGRSWRVLPPPCPQQE